MPTDPLLPLASSIKVELAHFSGSPVSTRWSILFPRHLLTAGAAYLADKCGAYWLMDAIASWQIEREVSLEEFQAWTLSRVPGPAGDTEFSWELSADDGGATDGPRVKIASQLIEYSDFPLESIMLYAVRNEIGGITIMLPGEY